MPCGTPKPDENSRIDLRPGRSVWPSTADISPQTALRPGCASSERCVNWSMFSIMRARRVLVEGLDAATAAFEVGYESASQFNREYSRFFGQPPMRDIRTLRSPGAPPLESVGSPQNAV